MKKYYIATVVICLAVLLACSFIFNFWNRTPEAPVCRVGFVYSEDGSTPYTYNFIQAQYALKEQFGDRVEILTRSNVTSKEAETPIRELALKGCSIIFVNADTEAAVNVCADYPEVQFCQVSLPSISLEGKPSNYHTFNGEVYQARYVAGIIAGNKLRQMLDSGLLSSRDAKVGYVAANTTAEVISGYTAFLLGVRSVAPEAVMRVRYTGAWSNYSLEKERAKELIDEGCLIIAQHTNTSAPAIACEEAFKSGRLVYHIGYHESMMDVAPSTAMVSLRTNWTPYIISATQAVMNGQVIEQAVKGNVHGNDISAGFEQDWVEMIELNTHLAGPGTEEKMNQAIEEFRRGKKKDVFRGNYTGVNPDDPNDTIDLSQGYEEHRTSSNPSFRYVLKDCIIIEN